jgi:DNA-binding transcriptional LysR family regulator
MTPFDDLALLRVLIRIVESGSISAAARSLAIPQPTLSRHLRTLEDRAGVRLVHRDTHHLHPTEAGLRLIASARNLLDLATDATDHLHQGHATLQGHLRLFATIDLGQTAVTRLIAGFLRDHAKVTAELGYTNRPVQMIEDGYDAGIVAGHITDERLIARPVASVRRMLVAAPTLVERQRQRAPREPGELKAWPWARLSSRQFGGAATTVTLMSPTGAAKTLRIAPILTSEGVTSLREAVRAGLALAVLPEWLIHDDLATGALVRVLPKWSARPIPLSLISVADRQRPARVQAFLAYAEAELANLIARATY